jgi:hypothetical protein
MMASQFGMNLKVHMQIHDVLIDRSYKYIYCSQRKRLGAVTSLLFWISLVHVIKSMKFLRNSRNCNFLSFLSWPPGPRRRTWGACILNEKNVPLTESAPELASSSYNWLESCANSLNMFLFNVKFLNFQILFDGIQFFFSLARIVGWRFQGFLLSESPS